MNYLETLNYIHSLGNFSKVPSLERIKEVLNKLENPQNSFKAIHIAGTNGKGSVSSMVANVFALAGFKTALFISPYIVNFRERIQVNGEYISEEDLVYFSQKVIDTKVELTEFEFITAVAFLYYKHKGCEVGVIEAGLGGRFDATNTLENKAVSVITKIGLDHTGILGDTIEKITTEKCGIIKNCTTVTSYNQSNEAAEILKQYNVISPDKTKLQILSCDLFGNTYIYKGEKYSTSLSGEHQIENSVLAIEAIKNSGFTIPYNIIYKGIKETVFPARLEVISKKPLVVLDGAHNPDGAVCLAQVLKNYNGKAVAIVGMMKDKDCDGVLAKLLPLCKNAVVVEVNGMPRSLTKEELFEKASIYCPCERAENYKQAIDLVANEEVIFVFGSLYLASGIREELQNFFI